MKNGFLFIDKSVDWTSRDVCNKISHIFNTKKVGHTGTLDPFATGLLIVALGSASKAIPYLEDLNKTYVAELTLGKKTNTGDLTGEVILEKEVPNLTKEEIKETLSSFLGEQEQIPPMTSAIHVNGKKLYELAHKGIEVERKARKVNIFDISLLSYEDNKIIFSCTVSKGTYIRTLGEDIAEKLNTVGYLTALRRSKIDKYNLEKSKTIDNVNDSDLIPIQDVLSTYMKVVPVDENIIPKIKNGMPIKKEFIGFNLIKDIIFIDKNTNEALAIYQLDDGVYKCLRGLWS